ncbi:MAG TPA: PAS domain-containing protein [Alphaproteobacteria bacterium]
MRHRLIDPAAIQEPKLRALLAYWNAKRGTRAMPTRADIDPLDVPSILPNIVLVGVSGEPPRFRFRIVGTDIVFRYGGEITGRDLEDVDLGSELGAVKSQYEETVRERVPTYCRHEIETGAGKHLRYERLLLPLAADGIHVDMLLGGIYAISSDTPIERSRR